MKYLNFLIYIFPLVLWILLSEVVGVQELYLPKIQTVITTLWQTKVFLLESTVATLLKIVVSLVLGGTLGILLPLVFFGYKVLSATTSIINNLRAVPATAILPFFLLWFGFSDVGKVLLLTLAFGLNIFISGASTLLQISEKDKILFVSFSGVLNTRIFSFWLYRILENILPTIRFGLTTVMGVVVVAEMLGSQLGLGYLIQTSRTTFSFDVVFLCAIIFGLLTIFLDKVITHIWSQIVYWKR